MRRSAITLMMVLFAVSSALASFELRPVYVVVVKNRCNITAKGSLHLNEKYGLYAFLNTDSEPVATGEFYFDDDGQLHLTSPLDVWGDGRPQQDGTIQFGDSERCKGYFVTLTPESRVRPWPF
jgi:hypothetical protein